jgi:hypothetical protein
MGPSTAFGTGSFYSILSSVEENAAVTEEVTSSGVQQVDEAYQEQDVRV